MRKLPISLTGKINHRNITTIYTVMVIGGFLLMLCAIFWLPLLFIGLASLLGGLYLDKVYWRCPQCFTSLPNGNRSIRICPHCKKKLYL